MSTQQATFFILERDFESAARRMKASFDAAGAESPEWQALARGLHAWAVEFIIHLAQRADFVVGQPLIGFAGSGLESDALRAARDAFTQTSGLDVMLLAKLNRQAIDWQPLEKGWNINASSIVPRRKADSQRWALFSSRGEQVTEWQTAPADCFTPVRLAGGWFWVWDTERF